MLTTPIASIAVVAGLILIALGLLGAGFQAKKKRNFPLLTISGAACVIFGCILSGLVLFKPYWFAQPKQATIEQQQITNDKGRDVGITTPKQNVPPPTAPTVPSPPTSPIVPSPTTSPTVAQALAPAPPPPKTYSQVLPILFVAHQGEFAQKLRSYLATKGYTINATNTDFSEIKRDNRQKAGTIRIIYKSTAKDFESILAKTIRDQFPTMQLVESLNDNARVDLQIQLW